MDKTIHLEKRDVPINLIGLHGYNGRTYKVVTCSEVELHGTYWDGGSKTSYVAVNLASGEVSSPKRDLTNPFTLKETPRVVIPPGVVIVAHSFFCGKDMGITIYARPDDMAPLLPAPEELTEDEKIVLEFTAGYKSSYAGIKNYRFSEASRRTDITEERWEAAKASLIASKHLNKQGAITPKGRNARPERGRYGW